jgi:hypothetical protein
MVHVMELIMDSFWSGIPVRTIASEMKISENLVRFVIDLKTQDS